MAGRTKLTAPNANGLSTERGAIKATEKQMLGLVVAIADAISPGGQLSIERYVAQIEADMVATRTIKGPDGKPREVVDERTQEGAKGRWERLIEKSLAYGVGLPIQRTVVEEHKVETEDQFMRQLEMSPALCDRLERAIREARVARESGNGPVLEG